MVYSACAAIAAVIALCAMLVNIELFKYRYFEKNSRSLIDFHLSSSVWCRVTNGTQLCTFKNLYYLPNTNQFLFVLTEHSILYGLKSKADLKSIRLSSVLNHNLVIMQIIIGTDDIIPKDTHFIDESIFVLWRFKWDNIMHVFHDDLFPLFITYLELCGDINKCVSKYSLGFVDKGEPGPYNELYFLFSKYKPRFLHNYNKTLCISEIHAGILSSSVWFQYGFGTKQGPVNSYVPKPLIDIFRDYFIQKSGIFKREVERDTVLFFNRKLNRRILNFDSIKSIVHSTVKEIYPSSSTKIIEVDSATHSITVILNLVVKSRIVIGMHGSAMILCMFLQPGSVVVELFPFGIQPKFVSFIRGFSLKKEMGIIYRSWVNNEENNSVPHPEAPPLLGGINHLSKSDQVIIQSIKTVPAVECCHNPMYLYRMFQDSIVGSDFKFVLSEALLEQSEFSEQKLKASFMQDLVLLWLFPAPVTNVTCVLDHFKFTAEWQPPLNIHDFVLYDITLVLDHNITISKNTSINNISMDITYRVQSAELWIKAIYHGDESVDSYTTCIAVK